MFVLFFLYIVDSVNILHLVDMRIETRIKVMEGKLAVEHPLLLLKQIQKNKFYNLLYP